MAHNWYQVGLDNTPKPCHPPCRCHLAITSWAVSALPHLPHIRLFLEGFSWQVDWTASYFIWSWVVLFTVPKQFKMKLCLQTASRFHDLPAANESHAVTQQSSCLFAALETSMTKADKKAFKSVRCSLRDMMKLQLPHIFQINKSRKLPSWWPELQEGHFCMKNSHLSPKSIVYMWHFACRTSWADIVKLNINTPPIRLRNYDICQTPLPTLRVFAVSV